MYIRVKKQMLELKSKLLELNVRATWRQHKRDCVVILLCLCFLCMLYRWTRDTEVEYLTREDYQCECPTTNGETELHQMTRHWSVLTNTRDQHVDVPELAQLASSFGMYEDIQNYTIAVNKHAYQYSKPKLFLRPDGYTIAKFLITEKLEDLPTDGGATFKIIVKGSHTFNSCGYRDYFDGSYTICCVLREPENDVEIYLMNVNFMSYQLFYSHHKLIHEVKVRSLTNIDTSSAQREYGSQWCYTESGYWVNLDEGQNTWRISNNNKLTHFFTKPELDRCFFEKYGGHIIMAGDAHLRAVFGYLQHIRESDTIITKEMTQKYPVVETGDMSFYVSTTKNNLVDNLRKILNHTRDKRLLKETTNKPRLLIINNGYHDLAYNNSAFYIAHVDNLLNMLEMLKDSGLFHIIFQNLAPWPHHMEHDQGRHLNYFVTAATSYWISKKVEHLDIPVADLHSLALPFEDISECGMHFLCHDFPREHKGVAGREAVQQILSYAC